MKWARGIPLRPTILFRGTADLCFLSRTPAVEMLDHLKANGVPVEEGPVRREGASGPLPPCISVTLTET